MNEQNNDRDFLNAFFSDDTERFRSPAEPDPGRSVTIRLRGPKLDGISVRLLTGSPAVPVPMRETDGGEYFTFFETELMCSDEPVSYYFVIEYRGRIYSYQKDGVKQMDREIGPDPVYRFRFTPGFHTPEWAKGAVQYQIFPDRFRNGDVTNDVQSGEYSYGMKHVRRVSDWNSPPAADDYRCFYGGDIAGILEKLDYLQSLGVEVIYLNPVFLSPSSHKYDTQDYEHIDPHFGVIEDDSDRLMQHWEHHNGYAEKYITRVLSQKNLEKSDALFEKLCDDLHSRGMKIILDGVFNHCGSYHRWMDREGVYREKTGFELPGAWQDENSPYRDYFRFTDEEPGYESWWGVETLPKLYYEQSQALCEEIFSAAEKWLKPPYCIDGWRLDVAADLGHDRAFNHAFWREFRKRVKAVNPDAIIIAEHYGDPSSWLAGDQWDTVMNYDAFMEPVTYFLTGMEKHSDGIREDLYLDGDKFFDMMRQNMARFRWCSLECAMNELSNHDHSRFLTRTNRTVGRAGTMGPAAAGEGVDKAVFREAVVIQMTWPGAPTIYYGDEAGQVGWTDPDNRRTYPWGREDLQLIELHRFLASLRKKRPVLRSGSFMPLGGGYGWIAYARFDSEDIAVTVCNNSERALSLSLRLRDIGARDGERIVSLLCTDSDGFNSETKDAGTVINGELEIDIAPKSAMILTRNQILIRGENNDHPTA